MRGRATFQFPARAGLKRWLQKRLQVVIRNDMPVTHTCESVSEGYGTTRTCTCLEGQQVRACNLARPCAHGRKLCNTVSQQHDVDNSVISQSCVFSAVSLDPMNPLIISCEGPQRTPTNGRNDNRGTENATGRIFTFTVELRKSILAVYTHVAAYIELCAVDIVTERMRTTQ
jgi:hypothetical protein